MTPLAVSRGATFLWVVLPYLAIATFVVGHVWRYRRDQFTWTTRSTQLLEARWLKIGSPLFHLGLLAVIGGHIVGILVPKSLTEDLGISEDAYHVIATSSGTLAGVAMLAGLAIMIARRLGDARVRATTRGWDVTVLSLLAFMVATGHVEHRGREPDRGRLRLPRDRVTLVPGPVPARPGRVADDGGRASDQLSAARSGRLAAVHGMALQPTRARVERSDRLSAPPPDRLPVARPAQRTRRRRRHRFSIACLGRARPRQGPDPPVSATAPQAEVLEGARVQPPRARATRDKTTAHEVSGDAMRVLIVATILFTIFFAVWLMFAIVAIPMRKELGLSESEFALLIAIPVLTGSTLRVPLGIITDKVGGRNTMIALLLLTAVPTWLVSRVETYDAALVLALGVGMAGTSFAVGIAWVSAWFPPRHQGFALGIFGAGNVGASITKLLAPTLVTAVGTAGLLGGVIAGGWRFVPAVYAILLVLCARGPALRRPTARQAAFEGPLARGT